jgi:hypothetical protein
MLFPVRSAIPPAVLLFKRTSFTRWSRTSGGFSMTDDYRKEQDRLFQALEDAKQEARERETRRKLQALGFRADRIDPMRDAILAAAQDAGATAEADEHAFAEQGLERNAEYALSQIRGRKQ